MNFQKYKDILRDFGRKRAIEFEIFKEDYSERNPPPVNKKVYPSIKFWLALFCGISAVGASGLRVYDRFFQVAQTSGAGLTISILEAMFGVGAINIAIVAMSFAVAYMKRKMSDRSLMAGLITAVGISLIAGLGQSFAGLGMAQLMGGFDWVLAIALSALTALEYLSGDLMGVEWVLFETEKKSSRELYEKENRVWLTHARANIGAWKSQLVAWASEQGVDMDDVSEQNELDERIPQNRAKSSKNTVIHRQLFDEIYNTTNELPGVIQTAELLADKLIQAGELPPEGKERFVKDKKGSISTSRKRWMLEKGLTKY